MKNLMEALTFFESLRAEDEPWLAECYVPPPDFSVMASWRSVLVFGERGMGNTALRLAVERRAAPPGQRPSVLLARWPLAPWLASSTTGTALAQEQYRMALDSVARALLKHLAQFPEGWGSVPSWAQETLIWFIHCYFHGDLEHHVASLRENGASDGYALLRAVVTAPVKEILHPTAAPTLLAEELIGALEKLGLAGVWVMVAELEPWLQANSTILGTTLHDFLTTLALFEHPRFAYKMFLPAALESTLGSAGSVIRHRAEVFSLRWQWQPAMLRAMVERRLAFALAKPQFTLHDLCELPNLTEWLQRCGGYSPRGWLQFARPFLSAYLATAKATGDSRPLSKKACREAQRQHAPRLFLDEATGQVTVGLRTIEDLPAGLYALLRYLYQRRGRVCSWRELHRVYLEAYPNTMPDPDARRAEYAGMLDTAIWRLRQEIEPDPKHHVLIVTVKQSGVRLDNAW